MRPDKLHVNVIEKIMQWHGMDAPPKPDETPEAPEAPQLIPLADDNAPLPAKLTGVKHTLNPGDTVTISGDSKEYLVAAHPSPRADQAPHGTIERPAKKHRSTPPANAFIAPAIVSPLGDPNTSSEMDAYMVLRMGQRDGGPSSSLPPPSPRPTPNKAQPLAAVMRVRLRRREGGPSSCLSSRLPSDPTTLNNAPSPSPQLTTADPAQQLADAVKSRIIRDAAASFPKFGSDAGQAQPKKPALTDTSEPANRLNLQPLRQGVVGAAQLVLPAVQTTEVVIAPTLDKMAAKRDAVRQANAQSRFRLRRKARESVLKELSKAAVANLESVPRMSMDYVQVMLHLGSMDVVSVRMMRNEAIDMAFAVAVSGVVGDYKLVKVLHGTNVDAIDAIVREGFKVGGEEVEVRNGSANGKGVYLTTAVKTAVGYSAGSDCKYLMLCELCVDPKCIVKHGIGIGTVYVQPDKALVRPLYVVEFAQPVLKRNHKCEAST